jgi:hypothetical protein
VKRLPKPDENYQFCLSIKEDLKWPLGDFGNEDLKAAAGSRNEFLRPGFERDVEIDVNKPEIFSILGIFWFLDVKENLIAGIIGQNGDFVIG